MATSTAFDAAAFKRSIEQRDAPAQLAMFADDALVEVIDRMSPPSTPRVMRGRDTIREWIEDTTARDMTHRVSALTVDGDHAAYTVDCEYPDGTRVLCMSQLDLRDGQIVHQRGLQAWDE
jgi:ketosteroid isomerase-like protein